MKEILTVLKKEIKDTLRDRRTLITAIIMPIVLMPLLMVGSFKIQESQQKSAQNQEAIVAIENGDAAPELVNFLSKQDKIKISDAAGKAAENLKNGVIQSYLVIPNNYSGLMAAQQPVLLDVYQQSTNLKSAVAAQKVQTALTLYNDTLVAQKLTTAGLNPGVLRTIVANPKDTATEQEKGGFVLGFILPMFIVVFSIAGGMYVAIDVSAGEKERKTLEALLITPLSRFKIVTGKFLTVAATSITSVVLSIGSMYVAFKFWPPDIGLNATFNLSLSTIALMIGMGVILSIMFAGFLLAVAIFAKSYKEAQNYITPFYLLAILPISLLSALPSFKPPLGLFLIPSLNAVFLFKESLVGQTVWPHIILTVVSTVAGAVVAIVIATKIFSKESILFRD